MMSTNLRFAHPFPWQYPSALPLVGGQSGLTKGDPIIHLKEVLTSGKPKIVSTSIKRSNKDHCEAAWTVDMGPIVETKAVSTSIKRPNKNPDRRTVDLGPNAMIIMAMQFNFALTNVPEPSETSAFLAETKDSWIADSGATDHMTSRREWFSTFEEIPEGVHPVCLGDGKQIYAKVSSAELKKLRTPVRARFTKAFNELETEIKKKEVKKADVEKILRRLQTHHEKLLILNMRMEEALLRESASEDIFTAEYESVCEYEDNFSNIMTDYEALAKKDDVSTISGTAAMNYRLPKLEFKKFGGEPREWITFWSQFSTIDRDPQMPPETKFQYLFQATAENSEAREAVESFPPSADNYPKAIEYIK
ncbi:hypothetical protein LAZ67_2002193 [Cordylochernes scorpioides]|uniref:Retrovirus-related Pol polyprotein from transposon TNT 1-94-like beta-barrel domain-containing protein n=1 Tax=Cordylochernes scorpioides TaxID=51811 RepID=A0ABY6K527_9ARAC|nr:hypothetical protein LAZ67_2002193 [Cordylochernes scorpioides]